MLPFVTTLIDNSGRNFRIKLENGRVFDVVSGSLNLGTDSCVDNYLFYYVSNGSGFEKFLATDKD